MTFRAAPVAIEPELLSEGWLRRRLAAGADAEVPREEGVPEALTPAAVLVPIVLGGGEPTVLLTRRTDHLHHHPGQISFPGGRMDAGDQTLAHTALRETREEIGLSGDCIELLGRLPQYQTGTGFDITPLVGFVRPPLRLELDGFEVAEVFEVPLAFLLDPANHQRHRTEIRGRMREYYAIPYQGYFIWGATAGMLVTLYRCLVDG
jgi:8-oxo-dGTP pyrophosphatase MutT (NUDIX family)